jgi:UDP-N-acetylmuramate dehydrogenase
MTIDIQQLRQAVQGEILKNEPMSLHTSFKIGGPADWLVLPASEQDVAAVLAYAGRWNLPLTVLGNGTNVLVRDKGIRGIVLQLGNALKGFQQEGNKLVFDSGYSLILAAKKAGELGLSGMEFAAGIPGSIGGAVYMNAGAYDGEMSNIVTRVWALTRTGEMQVLDHEQLEFSYRHTSLQNSGRVVLKAELSLQQGDRESVQAKMADFNQRRENKQPLEMPSAGSTFKRPSWFLCRHFD